MTDQQKIDNLEKENKELKSLIKEGKEVFGVITDVLGIEKAAKGGFFGAKIGSMIMKAQKNPEIVENISLFTAKLNNYKID